jgi:hypothetical protein
VRIDHLRVLSVGGEPVPDGLYVREDVFVPYRTVDLIDTALSIEEGGNPLPPPTPVFGVGVPTRLCV